MGESKQVKVDNWGIFFLQRLQTFFNKTYFCDLTLQFEDNVQLKVHRLVMNACTEYFQVLEQTCEVINDCLIMPPDLQADVVVPIVNFMYTGILEFQTSIFDRLYSTARLMNMTVLTKLLDAQKVPISPIHKPLNKRSPISPITWNLQGKKISPKTMDPDLPETLPGRKLPIWKRKSVPAAAIPYRPDFISALPDPLTNKYFRTSVDETPKPTRFEWPEDDDANFDTNSFDEISYTSKPIILPQREKSPKPSTSSNNFEELKRSSVAQKRPASPIYSDSKKVNIQDVKEYIKEQKLRSDYIDYDDSEAADNDLQTYENDNNDTDDETNREDVLSNEDNANKSILKSDTSTPNNKRVRFSLEGKENAAKISKPVPASAKTNTAVDMTNHTKIITEVLKKYPHLVKKNKNIKLKILAKGANTGLKPIGTPVKVVKQPTQTTKVSYMVMKPGEGNSQSSQDIKKEGHWSCHKCCNPNPLIFETYYSYRKHMTEVHQEKADSQMCNICGHISRKQNLLMYHKLSKHNIIPPPSYQFPKCKSCDYIALSASMLQKHEITHTHQNLICAECNTSFATKTALITHIQLTGHANKNQTFDCTYCTKKFISDETLFNHIKNNHKTEARRDNLISQLEEEELQEARKDNLITTEEIDALEEQQNNQPQEKPKEKIKILSDVKVTTVKNTKMQPVKLTAEQEAANSSQPLEPSSEAESLSNVASGIAASLGLVNTIVVLDENQFILQSQDGSQDNIIAGNSQNIILPDVSNINNIQNLVSQHQVITTDTNTIISQAALNKNNIASTDELVMVLTDHDYSDASNNVITSENSNIVVLYSHPVQSQDGQFISQPGNLMLNSDMGLVEVSRGYAVPNTVPIEEKPCEESIELIQQEINNHLDGEPQESQQNEKIEEHILEFEETIQQQEIQKEILQEQEDMEVDIPVVQQLPTEEQLPIEEITTDQQLTADQQLSTEQHLANEPLPLEQELTSEQLTSEQQLTEQHFSEQQLISDQQLSPEQQMAEVNQESNQELQIPVPTEETESTQPLQMEQPLPVTETNNYEEPMEIEESIEMIKEEIRRNSTELQEIPQKEISEDIPPPQKEVSEDLPPTLTSKEIQETDIENLEHAEQLETEEGKETSEKLVEEITKQLKETKEQLEAQTNKEQEIKESGEVNESVGLQDYEPMEVDSAKILTSIVKNQIENIEPIKTCGENSSEKTSDDIRQQEEEKSQNVDQQPNLTTEIQENIAPPLETQQIESETTQTLDSVLENTEQNITVNLEPPPIVSETEENQHEIIESQATNNETVEEHIQTTQDDYTTQESSQEKTEIEEFSKTDTKDMQNNKESHLTNPKISNLLDDWDDGDTDSQQSVTKTNMNVNVESGRRVVSTLINDWEDEEDT